MSKQLYRSVIYDHELGDPRQVDVFDNVIDAVKRDCNPMLNKSIVLGNPDARVLEMLAEDDLEFVTLVKSNGFRLRDVVYFYIKENKE